MPSHKIAIRCNPARRAWLARTTLLLAAVLTACAARPPAPAEPVPTARLERDRWGAYRITADTPEAAAYAQGVVHARDRYLQMDLHRRGVLGELAELLGPGQTDKDVFARAAGVRAIAERAWADATPAQRELLRAYTRGVNEALDESPRPPGYRLLRARPEPWSPIDSIACMIGLPPKASIEEDRRRAAARRALPPPLAAFLANPLGDLDAPLRPEPPVEAPLPDASTLDLRATTRSLDGAGQLPRATAPPRPASGASHPASSQTFSNAWAVGARRTEAGLAMLAADPHSGLSLPPRWHRGVIRIGERWWAGAGVPGIPGMLVGATPDMAWAFVTPRLDTVDLVSLDRLPTPHGAQPRTETRTETIRVRRGPDRTITLTQTAWGAVLPDTDPPLVLRWATAQTGGFNLDGLNLLATPSLTDSPESFSAACTRARSTTQEVVFAASDGRVGVCLTGAIPDRGGSPAQDTGSWDRLLDPDELPRVISGPEGSVWACNNRVFDAAASARIGREGWDRPSSRAVRAREHLANARGWTTSSLADMQLDTRSPLMARYASLVRDACADLLGPTTPSTTMDKTLQPAAAAIASWDGDVDAASTAYPIVRAFRAELLDLFSLSVRGALQGSVNDPEDLDLIGDAVGDEFVLRAFRDRPPHLLPTNTGIPLQSWDHIVRVALFFAVKDMERDAASGEPWGTQNRLDLHHPLAPLARNQQDRWAAPASPQAGDRSTLRLASPRVGSDLRLVLVPGDEAGGGVSMPGGQGGNPDSPWFLTGHDAWLAGRLLPHFDGAASTTETILVRVSPQ